MNRLEGPAALVILLGAVFVSGCDQGDGRVILDASSPSPPGAEVLGYHPRPQTWPIALPTRVDHIYRVSLAVEGSGPRIEPFVVIDVTFPGAGQYLGRSEHRPPVWMLDDQVVVGGLGAADAVTLTIPGVHDEIASSVLWARPPGIGDWTAADIQKAIDEARSGKRPRLVMGDGNSPAAPVTVLQFDERHELAVFQRSLMRGRHHKWRGEGKKGE